MESKIKAVENKKETLDVVADRKLFHKDFTLVVMGQIISLFGNGVLRFALPLYILKESGSPALFGMISAIAFLPMIIMSPIGGILADRINKQQIMVVLDFFTAAIILIFILLSGRVAMVPAVIVVMMLLYAIQGAYTPAVQASLPLLAKEENLVSANAVVNLVQSLSGLLGPVIGGMLYGSFGLSPILIVSAICFAFSAVLELFIRIPHQRVASSEKIWQIVKNDMQESIHFILQVKPVIAKVMLIIFLFNLFLSTMISIGLPVLLTQNLGISDQMYGVAQGALAAGGLLGGLLAGVLGRFFDIRRSWLSLALCAVCLIPMGLVFLISVSTMTAYAIITGATFLMMILATVLTIQMLAFVQEKTPVTIVGKVISFLMAFSICAQPIGQSLYGLLFEQFTLAPWIVVFGAAAISFVIAIYSKRVFSKLT